METKNYSSVLFKRLFSLVYLLFSINTLQAQCSETPGRKLWYPDAPVCGNEEDDRYNGKWGSDPWDVRQSSSGTSTNKNDDAKVIGIHPEGTESFAACWFPLYNDKTIFYDPIGQPAFDLPLFQTSTISSWHWGHTFTQYGIIFTTNLSGFPCHPSSFSFTPSDSNVGTTTPVYSIIYAYMRDDTFHKNIFRGVWWTEDNTHECYIKYSQFNITVVQAPQWRSNRPNRIARGERIRLEDFADTIDPAIEFYWRGGNTPFVTGTSNSGTWISTENLSVGRHWMKMKKKYDNGWYTSIETALDILPKAPGVNFNASQHLTLSCIGKSNGRINIPGSAITSEASNQQIIWALYIGERTEPCLGNCGGNIPNQIITPESKDNGITINNLSPGTYTLMVENPGGDFGQTYSTTTIQVGQVPDIQITTTTNPVNSATNTHITCRGASTGQITISASGGDAAGGYTFKLKKDGLEVTGKVDSNNSNPNTCAWHNLPAGAYIAEVTKGIRCDPKSSPSIDLTQPDAVTATPTPADPTCLSEPNGRIGVNITSAPNNRFEYKLLRGNEQIGDLVTATARSRTYTSLPAGSYTVEIKNPDISGCVLTSLPVTLGAPGSLALRLDSNPTISCFGTNTGRLELTGSGGSGSYTYILNNQTPPNENTTGIFTGLSAGTYTVTLKNSDAACTDSHTASYTVWQNSQLSVVLTPFKITCHQAGDGKILSTASGGIDPRGTEVTRGADTYKYHWQCKDNANEWQACTHALPTQKDVYNMEPGTYRVVLEDGRATDCTTTSSEIILTDPPPLQIKKVLPKDAVCKDDGAHIEVTAAGGYGNYVYSYLLDAKGNYIDFTRETKLATGSYKIKVRDTVRANQNECSVESNSTYRVTVPNVPLDFTVDLSRAKTGNYHISCHGEDSGIITAAPVANSGNGTGGNETAYIGYQYKINNEEYKDTGIFGALPAGTYNISVRDARGCVVTKTVTLTQPPVLAYTGSKTDINCFGNSTGTLTPNATGGVAPYTVTVNDIARPVNSTIPGLPEGSYRIHIADDHNCKADATVSIEYKHDALRAAVEEKDIRCFGEKGRATITPTGGDGHYTIRMSSNNWTTQGIVSSTNELEAGTYHFKVEDGLACSVAVPQPVVITSPPTALSFTYTLSDYSGFNISCKGGNNGHATLTASGGNGANYSGYTFALDDKAYTGDPRLKEINAGPHILKVKDARLCEVTSTIEFTESQDRLSIRLVSKEDVPCANSTSGTITVLGGGGAGEPSELKYSRDNQLWQSSPTFPDLKVAVYTVWTKDINDCRNSINVEILSGSPAIVIDQLHSQDIACLHDKASIRVERHGGTGTLTPQYSRNGGTYISFTHTTPFEEGDYTVRVKDEAACFSSVSAVIHFTSPQEALTFSTVKSDYHGKSISCHGLSTGSLRIEATGGNGATYNGYTYSLNEGNFESNNRFTTLAAGTYSVRVKDARGCISTQSHELKQPEAALSFDIESMINPKCGAEATGKIVLQAAQGGTPDYQYSLDGVAWQPGTAFEGLLKGNYTFHVKDVNECTSRKTALLESQYIPIVITASITHVKCFGQFTGAINTVVSGGHGNFTCRWNNEPAQASVQNLPAGNYQLRATDESGCLGTFDATISQPPALTLQLEALPICDGHTNGKITATAAGGVAPYLFSLNDQAGQQANVFNNLTHETYTVKVTDAHACTTPVPVTIGKLNVKPDVNFLAATRKNALDTLTIKEISLPAPDHVNWVFDPRLEFICYEDKSPLIKCKTAGTYWVEMTGQWNSCHYVVKKEITVRPYDPLAGPGKRLPVKVIGEATLSPNPTRGNLHLSVKLTRRQQLTVFIYSMSAHLIERRQYEPGLSLEDDFTFSSDIASGTYILRVIAENDSRDMKFILTR